MEGITKAIQYLSINELSRLVILIGARINDMSNGTVDIYPKSLSDRLKSVSDRLNSALTNTREGEESDDYDQDDHDPSVETPNKFQLDLELHLYRFKDPRLSESEKNKLKEEVVSILNN